MQEIWAEIQRRAMRSLVYSPPKKAVGRVGRPKDKKRRRTGAPAEASGAQKSLFKRSPPAEVKSILSQREFGFAVMCVSVLDLVVCLL
jgi:hypothetical protein